MSKGRETIDSCIIEEYVDYLDKLEILYRYLRCVEINHSNIRDFKKILNLLEMQEDCIRITRALLLKNLPFI